MSSASTLPRMGRLIYPARGAFGVPLMAAVLLLCRPTPYLHPVMESARSLIGWAVLGLGLLVRVWGVACWFHRDARGVIGGERLMVADGPYAYVRNPRYLGNLFMGLGAAVLAGIGEVVLAYAALWLAIHWPIMAAERETLAARHGSLYEAYCGRVPTLWPRYDAAYPLKRQLREAHWAAGLHEEMGTVMGWLALGLFVEGWRVAHLSGSWWGWGPQWPWFLLILPTLAACQWLRGRLRAAAPGDETRPVAP